jgi:hypothetical protein
LNVALGSLTVDVIEHHGHSVTWRFCKAHVPRNYGFKHLRAEETVQVGSDLLG